MLVMRSLARRRQDGFTMIELLITILIVTVGLLGLAKMQATAISNTSVARTRALMTYQAESLAGIIRSNRLFWVTSGNPTGGFPSFSIARNTGVVSTPTPLDSTGPTTCVGTDNGRCSGAQLAYDDLTNSDYGWAPNFKTLFPGAAASITCVSATGGTCGVNPTKPHGYDITLTWSQKMVAMNKSTAGSQTQDVSIVMHVQP